MNNRKLIVCESTAVAEIVKAAFELGEEWDCCSPYTALTGRRYDKIVVFRHDEEMSDDERSVVGHLATRMRPEGRPNIITIAKLARA